MLTKSALHNASGASRYAPHVSRVEPQPTLAQCHELLARYRCHYAHELTGRMAASGHQGIVSEWICDGRVFCFELHDHHVLPDFQLDGGQPRPVIAEVLAALPRDRMTHWEITTWFCSPNPELPGQARPADLLGTAQQGLLADAARRLPTPAAR